MINSEVDIILSRYFCGEATKKEHRILDNWLIESVENQNYFPTNDIIVSICWANKTPADY